MDTQKLVIGVIILIALALGAYLFIGKSNTSMTAGEHSEDGINEAESMTGDMMRAEANAVVAPEQKPGNSVTIAQVVLAAPGYVVIHEDSNGAPGTVLGASALLSAGQSDKITVALTRATKDGEKLHAMLHSETNGNSTFEAAADTPVQSIMGGPINGWFEISSTAEENVEVTI